MRDLRILSASWVVPVAVPPIRNGRVAVADDSILWVGRAGDAGEVVGPLRDLGTGVLMPGLVNAHCHLELSHLRGRIGLPRDFVPWVREVVESRGRDEPDAIRDATRKAIRELEETGTVAVGDVSNTLAHLDLLAASGLAAVVFFELLAWDPAKAAAILASAESRIASLPPALASAEVQVRLAAHAPHSVSPALFEALRRRGGPAAMHLAESAAETRFLAGGDEEWGAFLRDRDLGHVAFTPPGLSPVRYAETLGVLRPGLLAAHCAQVDGADRAILARRGVHVAVCPRSNRNLSVRRPPVPELLEAGVPLCLGTDSLASVESLDLIEDLVALRREFPGVPGGALVRMATLGGALALGLPDLGTIAPGKRAALVFAAAERPPTEPMEFLVSGEARPRRLPA